MTPGQHPLTSADRVYSDVIERRNSERAPLCWCGHPMLDHDTGDGFACHHPHDDAVLCSEYSEIPPNEE